MLAFALIGEGIFVLWALIVSARVAIRSRSALKGTLCLYGLFVLCVILFAVLIPGYLRRSGVPGGILAHSFPEAIGVVPVLLLGWVPALVCVAATRALYLASDAYLYQSQLHVSSTGFRSVVSLLAALMVRTLGGAEAPPRRDAYPKWVGVVLGFLLWGLAHFLSGKTRAGLTWYISLSLCGFLSTCLMAVPGRLPWIAASVVVSVNIVLWLIVLRQSYRPVRRIGVLGWLAVLVLTFSLNAGGRAIARCGVEAFKMTCSTMEPTIYGVRACEVPERPPLCSRLLARLWRGERYIHWRAPTSGTFGGPVIHPHLSPLAEFRVGSDSRTLPRLAPLRFKNGDRVHAGDLIFSGCIVAGDCVLVEKVSYRFRNPRRGEIIVFRTDGLPDHEGGKVLVFRVAGLPGETVEMSSPHLLVNGAPLTEPPIFAGIELPENEYGRALEQVILGEDEYFVLGDNVVNSHDSRYWGPVPKRNIVGRVTRIYRPFSRVNALEGKRDDSADTGVPVGGTMLTFALIGQGIFVLGALIFSARATIRRRSVFEGALCLYGLLVLGVILFTLVLPALLRASGVPSDVAVGSFPEEIGVVPVILLGWIPAFMYAGIVRLVCNAGKKGEKRLATTPSAAEESEEACDPM